MKFDCIVGNPPYDRTLHVDLLESSLKVLKGKLTFIEPSTWLINVRWKEGNGKRYYGIRKRLEGHVESVYIENLNNEFGTILFMPYAITKVDFSKTFDTIDFFCCGEHKKVNTLHDCNLIGEHKTIRSIIDKVGQYGDFMENHITKKYMGEGVWYAKYAEISGGAGGRLCAARTDRFGGDYEREVIWKETKFGKYCTSYTTVGYHFYQNEISDKPLFSYDKGKHLTEKIADNVYGTREELENWKFFIHNNKLPLFLNIVMTIDQHNNSKEFLPWLVDRRYTDEEISEMFGFTDEENKLIDSTINKYKRESPWFRRYMCGRDSATEEEISSYIQHNKHNGILQKDA